MIENSITVQVEEKRIIQSFCFFVIFFSSKAALAEKPLVQKRQRGEKIYWREKKNTDIKKLDKAERFCKLLQQRHFQKLTGRSQIS